MPHWGCSLFGANEFIYRIQKKNPTRELTNLPNSKLHLKHEIVLSSLLTTQQSFHICSKEYCSQHNKVTQRRYPKCPQYNFVTQTRNRPPTKIKLQQSKNKIGQLVMMFTLVQLKLSVNLSVQVYQTSFPFNQSNHYFPDQLEPDYTRKPHWWSKFDLMLKHLLPN